MKILIHDGKERGLNDEKIMNRIRNDKPDLVIVPDAGSNDFKQAHELTEMGIGLIVLDHHDIITPIKDGHLVSNQIGDVDRKGSGCLVTHKFLQALDDRLNVNYSKYFIDLVALSIISDSMDVTSMQNREYLYWGLFKKNIKSSFLSELMNKFLKDKNDFTQKDFAFNIIPKLNSVTRKNDVSLKQRILLAFMNNCDLEETSEMCLEAHKEQTEIVNNFIENNVDNINCDDKVIILCSKDIQRSYSGLIAGKLSEKYNRPCIVGKSHDNECIGSFRGNGITRDEISKMDGVNWASGHKVGAFGISLDVSKIESLRNQLNLLDVKYEPCEDVLKSYPINEIPNDLYYLFDGYDDLWSDKFLPKPKFHIKNIIFNSRELELIGKKKNTIRLKTNGLTIMYFNTNEKVRKDFHIDDDIDLELEIVGELNLNKWNGHVYPQIFIEKEKYEIKKYVKDELTIEDIF